MSVEDATRREIEQLRAEVTAPGMVAIALELARQMDDADAPTSAAVVARELRNTMLELRKVAPAAEEGDALDELTARRTARRGA